MDICFRTACSQYVLQVEYNEDVTDVKKRLEVESNREVMAGRIDLEHEGAKLSGPIGQTGITSEVTITLKEECRAKDKLDTMSITPGRKSMAHALTTNNEEVIHLLTQAMPTEHVDIALYANTFNSLTLTSAKILQEKNPSLSWKPSTWDYMKNAHPSVFSYILDQGYPISEDYLNHYPFRAKVENVAELLRRGHPRQDILNNQPAILYLAGLCDSRLLSAYIVGHPTVDPRGPPIGASTLHHAAMNGSVDNIRVLLGKGVCIDTMDLHGDTALHEACYMTFPEVVLLLLDSGASVTQKNKNGKTAYDIALESRHTEGCVLEAFEKRVK
eukprot:TRINITY_DN13616_c0_g2_i1.p1 TRINITY_DN13616_c0_g2~~TRINITY_DN13616_c0_g2_i1.p1  ORF type:complete len:341 (+),score=55.40 TRINITY_DN13616_c0_g2_i1:38-1024(+)